MRISIEMQNAVLDVLTENGLMIDDSEPEQIIEALAPLIIEECARELAKHTHDDHEFVKLIRSLKEQDNGKA